MVESSKAEELLRNLKLNLEDDEPVTPEDFLKILILEKQSDKRKEIYDALEELSRSDKWASKYRGMFYKRLAGKIERAHQILMNQLITIENQIEAEKLKITKSDIVIHNIEEESNSNEGKKETIAYVVDRDIMDQSVELIKSLQRDNCIIILSPAEFDDHHKLGSQFTELGAVCRRSNFPSLVQKKNIKLTTNNLVFYPELTIFSDSHNEKYPKPYKIKAFQILSQKDEGGENSNENEMVDKVKTIVRHLFRRAIDHEINILILTALGCGYVNYKPALIAKTLDELLCNEFKGAFEKVLFAIKLDDDKTRENYREFKNVFGVEEQAKVYKYI